MLSAHDVVTIALAYLAVGAVVWMLLYSAGFVHEARGQGKSAIAIALTSIGAVVGWPILAAVFLHALMQRVCR